MALVQQQFAELLAKRCATWFAGGHHRPPLVADKSRGGSNMTTLASAVDALEGDEFSSELVLGLTQGFPPF
jgi:hypothetical protein